MTRPASLAPVSDLERALRTALAFVTSWHDSPSAPVDEVELSRVHESLESLWHRGDGSDLELAARFVAVAAEVSLSPAARRAALRDAAVHLWAALDEHGLVTDEDGERGEMSLLHAVDLYRQLSGTGLRDVVPEPRPRFR